MPHLLLIFIQSDCLIRIVAINSHTYWQTLQFQISWLNWIYTVCKGRICQGSAWQGLIFCYNDTNFCYTAGKPVMMLLVVFWYIILSVPGQIQQITDWYVISYSPENRCWHFIQIVSFVDNLQQRSNPVKVNVFENVAIWFFLPRMLILG